MWLLLFPLMHSQRGWAAMHRLDRSNEGSVCKPLIQPCMNYWRYSPSYRGRGLGVELQVGYRYCIGNRGNKFCQLMRGHHSGTFMVLVIREMQALHQLAAYAAQGNSWSLEVQVLSVKALDKLWCLLWASDFSRRFFQGVLNSVQGRKSQLTYICNL